MRITNKIMQNNSLYNINNNKVAEDALNTMLSTGKKITRPSDDPVIAIRALRLRSSVTQISQYYEKNAKDAESWLDVTADALSTVTDVLTDCIKQATKGANMDLTLDDMATIITQMEALSKEYYATGNVDYAGRYVFTGYRTETNLSFEKTSTADYTDINDEFNSSDISSSSRVTGMSKLDSSNILDDTAEAVYQSDIVQRTVGRLRVSYDNLNYINGDGNTASLKWREELLQPATSTLEDSVDLINLTFTTDEGITHYASLPVIESTDESVTVTIVEDPANHDKDITYNVTKEADGSYTIAGTSTSGNTYNFTVDENGVVQSGDVSSCFVTLETVQQTTITYTNSAGQQVQYKVPLLSAIGQTYSMAIEYNGNTAVATVNSDGTYTIIDDNETGSGEVTENGDPLKSRNVVNVTRNGSIHSSYVETTLEIDTDHIIYSTSTEEFIDNVYKEIGDDDEKNVRVWLNAATGEILLNEYMTNKLSTLPDLINANTIDVIYDKKEWENGDIKPENLFNCNYTDENKKTIMYNHGSAAHEIAYDVGFSQSIVVNTTADAVFTTDVKRDIEDLGNILNNLKQVKSTIKTLQDKQATTTEGTDLYKKIKIEIEAAQKAYDSQRVSLQNEFERKITSMQKALDVANLAVADNGTRSKRLDLVSSRLMSQTTTFKTLQSENEDIDLAEAITKLSSAQVTYEASLMATGKISQSSLMNYI